MLEWLKKIRDTNIALLDFPPQVQLTDASKDRHPVRPLAFGHLQSAVTQPMCNMALWESRDSN
jgi:hypothetical protein